MPCVPYVPAWCTCQRASVPKTCQLIIFTCQHCQPANKRANVPTCQRCKGVPIFQLFYKRIVFFIYLINLHLMYFIYFVYFRYIRNIYFLYKYIFFNLTLSSCVKSLFRKHAHHKSWWKSIHHVIWVRKYFTELAVRKCFSK